LLSLVIVAALVRWFFGTLARGLLICVLQQTLLQQTLLGSGDGGPRTAACLRLAIVFVVAAKWLKVLSFITFGLDCTVVDDYL
jgi:hypothetical protein